MSASAALPAWHVRPYEPGDEEQLVALFSEVFGRAISVEWWRWKLKGLPSPVENVWVAVDEAGGIIGQYAGIPRRARLAGAERWVMVSVDTMTSPRFRRRGVLTGLATACYESWAAGGVAAVLGLPNDQWGSRTGALGWQSLFPLVWLRMPLRIDRLAYKLSNLPPSVRAASAAAYPVALARYKLRRRRLSGVGRAVAVSPLGPDHAAIDELWVATFPKLPNGLVRDDAWLQWRYGEEVGGSYQVLVAHRNGQMIGYVAYHLPIQHSSAAIIADLFTVPGDSATASRLLLGTLDDLWTRGASTVRLAASPDTWLYDFAVSAGFRPLEARFSFDIVPLDPTLDVEQLRDSAMWHLCAGDFDVA